MSKGKDQKNLPSQKPTDNKPLESSGVSDSRYIKIDDKFYSLKEAAEFRGTDEAGIIQHAIDCRTFIYLSIPDGRETRVTKKDLITFLAKPKISIKFSELRETFADYLSALEEQSNDDYRDGIKSSEKPFDTELKSIRAQYFKRASDCDYQVSTNNFKIYKHDLDLTNKSSEYSSLIDHAIGLKEISEELKKPIESILGYVSHGAIPLYYIVTHGYYKSLTMVDLDKFLEDIDIKIPMPIRDVEQLIRAKFVSRYAVNPSHSTKRFITMSRLRIFKEDLPALEKRLKVENNKENKKVKVKKKAKDDYNDVKLKMYVDWKGNYSNSIFEVSLKCDNLLEDKFELDPRFMPALYLLVKGVHDGVLLVENNALKKAYRFPDEARKEIAKAFVNSIGARGKEIIEVKHSIGKKIMIPKKNIKLNVKKSPMRPPL